jgi:hypothetical protein
LWEGEGMNEGYLPDKCPNCGKEEEYDYQDIHIEGGDVWQEIFCLNCEKGFNEVYTIRGWESRE